MIEKANSFDVRSVVSSNLDSVKKNQLPPQCPIEEADALPVDGFSGPSSQKAEYIVIPPSNRESQKANLDSHSQQAVDDFASVRKEELSLVGGYVAKLDKDLKEDLSQMGYQIFENKKMVLIPEEQKGSVEVVKDIDIEELKDLKPEDLEIKDRVKLAAPRFDSELTRKYTGKGIGVAVLDTGIYPHPDLTDPERKLTFVDMVGNESLAYDDSGHGTHAAGDLGSSGKMSNGLYKGLAPKSDLVGIKVMGANGTGDLATIIKGIQWCIDNKESHNIRVINMSLGFPAGMIPPGVQNPVHLAVKAAFDAGIFVVAAAGNEGPDLSTVGSPGDSPYVFTVGAADDKNTPDRSDDTLAPFSSKGDFGLLKPDGLAPGNQIISTASPASDLNKMSKGAAKIMSSLRWLSNLSNEELTEVPRETLSAIGMSEAALNKWNSTPCPVIPPDMPSETSDLILDKWNNAVKINRKILKKMFESAEAKSVNENSAYQAMPGTSMATPIVAGLAAEIVEANPDLKPAEIGTIIKNTCEKLPGDVPVFGQGAGMINPDKAIQLALDIKEKGSEVLGKLTFGTPPPPVAQMPDLSSLLGSLLPPGTLLPGMPGWKPGMKPGKPEKPGGSEKPQESEKPSESEKPNKPEKRRRFF